MIQNPDTEKVWFRPSTALTKSHFCNFKSKYDISKNQIIEITKKQNSNFEKTISAADSAGWEDVATPTHRFPGEKANPKCYV